MADGPRAVGDQPGAARGVVAAAEADDVPWRVLGSDPVVGVDAAEVEDGRGDRPCARGVFPLRFVAAEFDEQRGDRQPRRPVVGTLDADVVRFGGVGFERRDDGLLDAGGGAGDRSGLAAVVGGSEVPGEVGGQQRPRLAGVSGDEDETLDGLGRRKRRRRRREVDVHRLERPKFEAVGPVVGAAAVAVGSVGVVVGGPLRTRQQVLADVCRGGIRPADDDRNHDRRETIGPQNTTACGRGRTQWTRRGWHRSGAADINLTRRASTDRRSDGV